MGVRWKAMVRSFDMFWNRTHTPKIWMTHSKLWRFTIGYTMRVYFANIHLREYVEFISYEFGLIACECDVLSRILSNLRLMSKGNKYIPTYKIPAFVRISHLEHSIVIVNLASIWDFCTSLRAEQPQIKSQCSKRSILC